VVKSDHTLNYPAMSSTLINIITLGNSQAAYFLKSHLDSCGIESFLSFDDSEISRKMKRSEGVKVKVKDDDVEKAVEVILELTAKYGKLEDQKAKHFRKILVPVEFSDVAVTALQYAMGLAENLHGEIRLFHVYDDPLKEQRIKQTSTFEKYHDEELRMIEEKCKANIFAFTKKLKEKVEPETVTRARIHYSMALGSLDSEIIQMSSQYRPELIVLGISRETDKINQLSEMLCLKIVQNVTVPLLVVPQEAKFQSVKNINLLYATDFLDSDFTSLRTLLAFMAPFKVKYFCIHVENEDDNVLKVQKMHELQEVIKKDYRNYSIDLRLIKNEDMINGIMDFVKEENIHIISFTNPRRSMIYRLLSPNNLKRMVQQSTIPMFIFRS